MKHLLTLLLFCLSCFAMGQNNGQYHEDSLQTATIPDMQVTETSIEDSLKQLIPTKQGEDKLDAIYDLVKLTTGTEAAIQYIDMLEEEAIRQDNEKLIGAAYIIKTTHYLELSNIDSMRWWAAISKEYSLKHKRYDRYFLIESYLIQTYISNGNYELAQLRIGQMLDKAQELKSVDGEMTAYEIMGTAYIAAKQPKEAVEPIKKAIALVKEYAPDRKLFLSDYYSLLVQALFESKDYEQMLEHAGQWEQLLIDYDATKKGTDYENLSMDDHKMIIEAYRSMSYIYLGQPDESKQSLDKAIAYSQSMEIADVYLQVLYSAYATYYHERKENQKALEFLDKMILFAYENGMEVSGIDFQLLKSDILADMGQYKEAYSLRQQMNQQRDSLNTLQFPRQVQELRTIYEVDKIEAEAQMKEVQYRNRLTLILTVAILALLALAVILYFYRKKQVAYRELVRKGQQWAEIIPPADIPSEPEEDTVPVNGEAKDLAPDIADHTIMESLEQAMKEKRLYIDPELSLDKLAETLDTSRYYLSKAINHCTGKNYATYVNEYRVKEAIRILSDKKKSNLSVDGVAYESGFADRASFYRIFKKMTGLSPASFRSNLQAS